MTDHDNREPDAAGESSRAQDTSSDDAGRLVARHADEPGHAGLPVVLTRSFWEQVNHERPSGTWAGILRSRRAFSVAALTLAVVVLAAGALVVVDHYRQTRLLAARAHESAQLAQTVSALNARLQAIENVKGRDELAELRRSVGEMKSAATTSRELSAAIAQLSQKVEKLDRQQGAKLDKLGERVGQEANARTATLSARLDKLERKPAPAAPQPPPPAPQPPKFGAGVSMDPTGSIDRSRQVLRGYVVLGAQGDIALIGGRYGERAVRPGDYLPGAGRVERVERQGPNWVVVTEQGLIGSAYAAPY